MHIFVFRVGEGVTRFWTLYMPWLPKIIQTASESQVIRSTGHTCVIRIQSVWAPFINLLFYILPWIISGPYVLIAGALVLVKPYVKIGCF